ncbi:MAG: phosphate signaling complex protein PhoU [Gammaproteobacteria bacterium]|nr:phosphate signaling complex protein PhoU [Gammaproteobacteria bacterium]
MVQSLEGHSVRRFDGELNSLHTQVLEISGLAMDQARQALRALYDRDLDAARKVILRERDVDALEVKVDEQIVAMLARRAPLALDLRIIISFSKMVTHLERIGDEAMRVAELCLRLYEAGSDIDGNALLADAYAMGRGAERMLSHALEVIDTLDAERAKELLADRGRLQVEFETGLRRLASLSPGDSHTAAQGIDAVLIMKALERIGDHARNLAEYVVYIVSGTDVRHQQNLRPVQEPHRPG